MNLCTKQKHKTKQNALDQLKSIKKTINYNGVVFYCKPCKAFHIGRKNEKSKYHLKSWKPKSI